LERRTVGGSESCVGPSYDCRVTSGADSGRTATDCNEAQRLDPRQLRAVDMLAVGVAAGEVAAELGIDRSTLWRWRQESAFAAEVNTRRVELWQASMDRLRALVPPALDVLGQAVDGGDWKAAAAVLRLAGLDGQDLGRVGLTDAQAIEDAEAAAATAGAGASGGDGARHRAQARFGTPRDLGGMSVRRPMRPLEAVSGVVEVEVIVESSNPYAHLSDRQIAALLARYRPEFREAYREVFGDGGRGEHGGKPVTGRAALRSDEVDRTPSGL